MKCPSCGTQTGSSDAFCGNCGAPLSKSGSARSASQRPHYISAGELQPVHRGGRQLFLVLALVAGLLVGGFVIWVQRARFNAPRRVTTLAETRQPSEPNPPLALDNGQPTQMSAPAQNESAKEGESAPGKSGQVKHQRHNSLIAGETSPIRPEMARPPITADAPPQTPAVVPNLTSSAASTKPSHPAVQETLSETAPMPSLPESAAQHDTRAVPLPTPAAPVPTPSVSPPRSVYSGPRSGVANWSGKLDKGQALTIRDGTPSTGILSGSGLPGVPVRITIDQTNLGFGETPSAANGFRTLVLKSHNKHDKITIRWEVIE